MPPDPAPLPALLDRLEEHHGKPSRPLPKRPLDWVLWENAAYLVKDDQRRRAYQALRQGTGLRPEGILGLPREELHAIAALGGMLSELRVSKLIKIAETVQDSFDGDLDSILELPIAKARKALRLFPGIGAPGADKILLFTQTHAVPALDSNGMRVLIRLGYAVEAKSYSTTYRAATKVLAIHSDRGCPWLMRAHDLLRKHGQTLCKQNDPLCEECPLAGKCPSASGPSIAARSYSSPGLVFAGSSLPDTGPWTA